MVSNIATAVIGLGNIGGGVARNLARAGVPVRAADLDASKVESARLSSASISLSPLA